MTAPSTDLDPALAPMLEALQATGPLDFESLEAAEVRTLMDGALAQLTALEPLPAVPRVEDHVLPGPAGDLPVRLWWPPGDPVGTVAFFHGGGWVIGNVDASESSCRQLALAAEAVVMSVEYRLAPEHPFPAGLDDCRAATAWLADHARELGVDSGRLLVAGDSAGGNLAAVLAQGARTAGPDLAGQVLVYPATDLTLSHPSVTTNGEGYLLTRSAMEWFVSQYLQGADPADPEASPLLASDLSGLCPAVVATAGFDPLADEGTAYARALEGAGVAVTHLHFPDLIHGFLALGGLSASARTATAAVWAAATALLSP